jgi:hypothetical protein
VPKASKQALNHPSTQRIGRVVVALGPLANDVVFIGGAIAPLLQTDPPFAGSRPTKDVDGVVASSSYTDAGTLHETLRQLGFVQPPDQDRHIHRWKSPGQDGDLLDLVPAGEHPGGSGQLWDRIALESSIVTELDGGVSVRHASACAFMGLKWAAFDDRGAADPTGSHDLEDILALVASRPTLAEEVAAAGDTLRREIVGRARQLLADPWLQDLLAAHLNNAEDRAYAIRTVTMRLIEIGQVDLRTAQYD